MAKFNDQCPQCDSPLNLISSNQISSYPNRSDHSKKELSLHLACAEGCGYDCFHNYIFVSRVDEENVTADLEDFDEVFENLEKRKAEVKA